MSLHVRLRDCIYMYIVLSTVSTCILVFKNAVCFIAFTRVFRTMFKEGSPVQRLSSPLGRRRLNSSGSRLNSTTSSPQLSRKLNRTQPSPQKSKLISSVIVQKKKKTSPELIERSISTSPEPKVVSPFFEEPRQAIQEQVCIEALTHAQETCTCTFTMHVLYIILQFKW